MNRKQTLKIREFKTTLILFTIVLAIMSLVAFMPSKNIESIARNGIANNSK